MVDEWLDDLKSPSTLRVQKSTRSSFKQELKFLRSVLQFYLDYNEDTDFRMPVKKRHWDSAKLSKNLRKPKKDFTAEEFSSFQKELAKNNHGGTMCALATVQFYQALRISEAAALHWEDIKLDFDNPSNSRMTVIRSVKYLKIKGKLPEIEYGLKNCDQKELPLFPQTYLVLKELYLGIDRIHSPPKGLIFHSGDPVNPTVLTYRQIQNAYDRAMIKAGLPYRGTHVLRHGGCRNLYNQVSDTAVAGQLLGNANLQTTLIYAKRITHALNDAVQKMWQDEASAKEASSKLKLVTSK